MLLKFFPILAVSVHFAAALWPIPQHVATGKEILEIGKALDVAYNNGTLRWDGQAVDSRDLSRANIVQGGIARAYNAIMERGFVPHMLNPPGSDFEPSRGQIKGQIKTLTISDLGKNGSEIYSMTVGDRNAVINAESTVAVLRALETFTQLFNQHSSGEYWYTNLAPIAIQDGPIFPHRGLIFDVSREWYSVDEVKHTIDALAMAKMNKLHLVATNTQSWQVEIPKFPELTEKGTFYTGQYYSVDDIHDLYTYGVSRGVEIIMEIDMPGHSNIQHIYPELGVAYMAKPYAKYCSEPPCGSFRLNSTRVDEFLEDMFEDLLPRISPFATHFHTGGDEYKANNCALDPDIQSGDTAIVQPLMQKFVQHAHALIRKRGLTPIVWEETVNEWNVTLPKDTIVQSWRGSATPALAKAGYKVIDSSSSYYVCIS
ncbi:hypothetical protein NLG97_g10849 [Lecanicillium saksenae]|uniref:Uncharacterized protein n=1 Tax=Lecanicillium saksenae TaxID=468837 RepID=A0ACC1QDF6_9HYPO|nr:hypothetical protein NLG97_g10849 [Lecanicillium saksenae]